MLHRHMGTQVPLLQPRAERLTASLPEWTSLNASSWDTQLRYDSAADPLPLLKDFNVSEVHPMKKTKRLRSGAFGQYGEDIIAYENFFHKMRGGVFLEMGALDGYSYSNSLLFEKYLGWRGILIEQGPKNYKRLVRNRPRAVCLHMAVCDSPTPLHLVEQWGVGGVLEYMAPDHRRRWHRRAKPEKLPLSACTPLGPVLERLGVRHINFFSLDVEGAEMHVLRTIDFSKVTFDVIVMEALSDDEDKDFATRAYLESRGYAFYNRQAKNFWFFRRGFDASAHVGIAGGNRARPATEAVLAAAYDGRNVAAG